MVKSSTWRVMVLDAEGNLRGQIGSFESLKIVFRWRSPGTWVFTAPRSQVRGITRRSRIRVFRNDVPVLDGSVDRIDGASTTDGDMVAVSGTDAQGVLERRIVYPDPTRGATAQNVDEMYSSTGPAGFVLHRLVTRQAGAGAQTVRQVAESRVGSPIVGDVGNLTGWTVATSGTVTWSGQTATLSPNSSLTLITTNAVPMPISSMFSVVGDVTLSGFVTVTVGCVANTTAAGANFFQPGAEAETYTQVLPSGLGAVAARTLTGDAFWRLAQGLDWGRFYFRFETGAIGRTIEFHPGGGVFESTIAGVAVNASARWTNLAEEVAALCAAGGVHLRSTFVGQRPLIEFVEPEDKTGTVRFSTEYGNVLDWRTVLNAPRATRVIVGGRGEGVSRDVRERSNAAAETEWGRRVEVFRDAGDVEQGDLTMLDQRGEEILAELSATAGFSVELRDARGVEFGVDYQIGDRVGINLQSTGQPDCLCVLADDVIAEVDITVDGNGERVRPIVASARLADNSPDVYARVAELTERIERLERR